MNPEKTTFASIYVTIYIHGCYDWWNSWEKNKPWEKYIRTL